MWPFDKRKSTAPPLYCRIDPAAFEETEDHYLFQRLFDHFASLLGDDVYGSDHGMLAHFPPQAVALFFLWRASCELGGGGFEVYLLQGSSTDLRGSYEAFNEVGAKELIALFEAGVPLAAPGAEFSTQRGAEWFQQFSSQASYPDLQSLDQAAHPFVSDHLSSLAAAYIRRNSGVL